MEENGKLYIKEDISDWRDEMLQDESVIESEEDIVKQLLTPGARSAKIARATVVSVEMGIAPKGIIRENKVLLNLAAQGELARIMKKHTYSIQENNGNTVEVSRYVGGVATDTDNGYKLTDNPVDENDNGGIDLTLLAPYVPIDTEEGYQKVLKQIFYRIVPDIDQHLKKAKASKGNVREIANELKEKIDEIVDKIS